MRVCIVRNSEAKTNAGILRIVDALLSDNREVLTLTRTRFNDINLNKKVINKPFDFNNVKVDNYELQLQGEMGKGIGNLFTLLLYQVLLFFWLYKNKNKYDVIHAFDLDAGLPSMIISKIFKKKMVYHIADFYVDSRQGIPSKLKNLVKKLEFMIINKSTATIICTDERKEQIQKSKPNNLHIIYNSPLEDVNLNESNIELKQDKNEDILTLCYVGGLSNIRFINEVINIVKSEKKFQLNIAGHGNLENAVIDASHKYENINYYGRIDYDHALKLYSQCDVMFAMYDPKHPNHRYSAPNKVYESMMLGKLIIVAQNTGIDSLVEREKIGFSINYNENEFRDTLYYLLNNKNILNEIKFRSSAVYEKYSWGTMRKRVKKIYSEL